MRDLEQAIRQLPGHTLALCRGEAVVLSDKRGVAPLADFIREGRSFPGYAAADRVVGKASAMLLIKVGVTAVYAGSLSQAAADLLEAHGVYAQYHTLVPGIMNRDKRPPPARWSRQWPTSPGSKRASGASSKGCRSCAPVTRLPQRSEAFRHHPQGENPLIPKKNGGRRTGVCRSSFLPFYHRDGATPVILLNTRLK